MVTSPGSWWQSRTFAPPAMEYVIQRAGARRAVRRDGVLCETARAPVADSVLVAALKRRRSRSRRAPAPTGARSQAWRYERMGRASRWETCGITWPVARATAVGSTREHVPASSVGQAAPGSPNTPPRGQ